MNLISRITEWVGIDWIPLLFKNLELEDEVDSSMASLPALMDVFTCLCDEEKLEDAVNYCGELLRCEEDRSDKIESKAFTLVGTTGLATGFITGFVAFLLDQVNITSTCVLVVSVVIYVLIVISLTLTVLLAMKVTGVQNYRFVYPNAKDILRLADASLTFVKQERAASLFYSYVQNQRTVNVKATYVCGAQLWFRNSVVLLLILALMLSLYMPYEYLTSQSNNTSAANTLLSGVATPIAVTSLAPTPFATPFPIMLTTTVSFSLTVTPTYTP